jgi:hypothetical protein
MGHFFQITISLLSLRKPSIKKGNSLVFDQSGGGHPTVGKHMVVFALNANFLNRASVLQALYIVPQAWSTMRIPLGIITKFYIFWKYCPSALTRLGQFPVFSLNNYYR